MHMMKVYDQDCTAGKNPGCDIDIHQHIVSRNQFENCKKPDHTENDGSKNGNNRWFQGFSHSTQSRTFDFVACSQSFQRADMLDADNCIGSNGSTGRIDADKEITPYDEDNGENFCESETEKHTFPENLFASLQISGSEVLTGKCNGSLCKCIGNIVCKIFKVECQG